MRAIVTSSKSWVDEDSVIEAVCELPAGSTILLPSRMGACKVIWDNEESLKMDLEDWSLDDSSYDQHGGSINTSMLDSEVDMVIAFLTPDSHSSRDCIKRARQLDLEVKVLGK
jgi:hypothetical protein